MRKRPESVSQSSWVSYVGEADPDDERQDVDGRRRTSVAEIDVFGLTADEVSKWK